MNINLMRLRKYSLFTIIAIAMLAASSAWAANNNPAGGGNGQCNDVQGMYIGEKRTAGQVDTGRSVESQRLFVLEEGGSFISYELQAISYEEVRGTVATPGLGSWVCNNGVVHAIAFESFAYGTDLAAIGGKSLIDATCKTGKEDSCRRWAEYDRWSFKFDFNKSPAEVDYFLIGILQSDDDNVLNKEVAQTVGELNENIQLRKLNSDGDSIRNIVECDLTRITDSETPGGTFGYVPDCD